jgi:catechol 2,3-dioxygenase-like lactoylglutathione lyase family enzyme
MIDGIDHFVLTVRSREATLSFYERTLGMTRQVEEGRPASLLFGDQKINIHEVGHTFEPKAVRPTPGAGDFCLITSRSLDEMRAHIERCGVRIELGPVKRHGARGAMTSLYFRDPDNNLVEVSRYESE